MNSCFATVSVLDRFTFLQVGRPWIVRRHFYFFIVPNVCLLLQVPAVCCCSVFHPFSGMIFTPICSLRKHSHVSVLELVLNDDPHMFSSSPSGVRVLTRSVYRLCA